MDYLSNLLVGPTNKLKTTGIIFGSLCVGIIGIVSAAFISYSIIEATISTTLPNAISLTTLSITSPTANITSSSLKTISKLDFDNLTNTLGTTTPRYDNYNSITFSATVDSGAIARFDIYLYSKPCYDLKIYKIDNVSSGYIEYSKMYEPGSNTSFTGLDIVNETACYFSLYIKDNGRGDENRTMGVIADPLLLVYNTTPTTTITAAPVATTAAIAPTTTPDTLSRCLQSSFINTSGTIFNTNALNALNYQIGQVCTWVIQAPDGLVPVISFDQFNTESDYDYFYVYNGNIDTNNLMYQLSGSLSTAGFPANITGTSSIMTLKFTSNSEYVYSGVVGTVTFIQK